MVNSKMTMKLCIVILHLYQVNSFSIKMFHHMQMANFVCLNLYHILSMLTNGSF